MGLLDRLLGRKPKKSKKKASKPKRLTEKDILHIKAKAESNAAAYAKEWARKNPELARKFK